MTTFRRKECHSGQLFFTSILLANDFLTTNNIIGNFANQQTPKFQMNSKILFNAQSVSVWLSCYKTLCSVPKCNKVCLLSTFHAKNDISENEKQKAYDDF